MGGESEWFKCLIPTTRPPLFVQLGHGMATGLLPLPSSPSTSPSSHPSSPCPPPRAREMGPLRGPRGRAGRHLPSILPCRGAGMGSGEAGAPPTPPLPVPYILERPPSLVPPSEGGLPFALSSPPQAGPSRGTCITAEPPRREEADASGPRSGRGGFWGGFGVAPRGPLAAVQGASHLLSVFPLSRSKNTKLGTPGAPHPGSLAPSTPPPPPRDRHL